MDKIDRMRIDIDEAMTLMEKNNHKIYWLYYIKGLVHGAMIVQVIILVCYFLFSEGK
jgi:hypothetical protein